MSSAVVAVPRRGRRAGRRAPGVVEPAPVELGEEAADEIVGGGDLAIVGVDVARAERLRRAVGGVRFVEMEEEKKRASRGAVEETDRGFDSLAARTLRGDRRAC